MLLNVQQQIFQDKSILASDDEWTLFYAIPTCLAGFLMCMLTKTTVHRKICHYTQTLFWHWANPGLTRTWENRKKPGIQLKVFTVVKSPGSPGKHQKKRKNPGIWEVDLNFGFLPYTSIVLSPSNDIMVFYEQFWGKK